MRLGVLDCTLRDGGYLVDKKFSEGVVLNIASGLVQAGIEYVELGFLQDSIGEGETVCFRNSTDARKYIPQDRRDTHFTAFADFGRYSIENLDRHDGLSFDCVRVAFHKADRKTALEFCGEVKAKGYKVFVQPMVILRYTNAELLDLLADINELMPYCIGIVDTFGSMYLEDLRLKLALVHYELLPGIMMGFHSHNNKEMSNALSMEFVQLMKNERDIAVDSTLYGMGRGAGNTRTEVIVDYLNRRQGKRYDLPTLLDVIDNSVRGFSVQPRWGYDLHMYLAGIHSSHVSNIDYLSEKASLRTKDVSWILGSLTDDQRAKSDFGRLDELYLQCMKRELSRDDVNSLREIMQGRPALIVAPGNTVSTHENEIRAYIASCGPVVVSINFAPSNIDVDFVYFNNSRRYDYFMNSGRLAGKRLILTSNVDAGQAGGYLIPAERIIAGTDDNSAILLLNLLDLLGVSEIALAGFDGFTDHGRNYVYDYLIKPAAFSESKNRKISALFSDFLHRTSVGKVLFVTPSKFDRSKELS